MPTKLLVDTITPRDELLPPASRSRTGARDRTLTNNPKGNADTERFLRTLKEELVWLHEWTSPAVFFDALERWIAGYNQGYLHSTLGYRSPEAFEAEHLSRATPLPAAC